MIGCALDVAGFLRVNLVRSGAPWVSLGSYGLVWFVRMHPGGRWVRLGSSCSSDGALSVVGFVMVRVVRLGAPWVYQGSFRFTLSSGSALGVARLVRVCLFRAGRAWGSLGSSGSFRSALGVAGFFSVFLVCSCGPLRSLSSFGFVWFVWVCYVSRWVLSRSSGLSEHTLVGRWLFRVPLLRPVAGFIRVALVR